ncbi:hypothetical protein DSAG12_02861 [Promethearchaeum syntrophicum]|uniref:Uncharacterized protein n=1 Tax=Promethearchaeum syntrophicum TaxID=2594042 RepID=A0A5B9DCJ6_9ARCH|nr:hypothetical protein [Candidatus Prometheoarchaeum syntrophicum]
MKNITDKFIKGRKKRKAELNKNRKKDIQELADIKVESRSNKHDTAPNRYKKYLENKKKMKRARELEKKQKPYIWNKKKMMKRSLAEAEK